MFIVLISHLKRVCQILARMFFPALQKQNPFT
jgi:hypothetical protein